MQGLKRTVTAGTTRSQPYSFVFDPMSDGSDSSSSDDEVGTAKTLKKHEHETVEERHRRKAQEHERRQMKKGLSYRQFKLSNDHMKTKGKVSGRDGRLRICVNETAKKGYLAKAFGATIKHHLDIPLRRNSGALGHRFTKDHVDDDADAESIASSLSGHPGRPKLNIVIMVIGSRGDIQPFMKIGKILQHKYGHRVRVATHPAFRDFVEKDVGLEFFSVGGDPAQLMAFMVKNPGLMPSFQTVREGEIKRRRDQMAEMMDGFWRACINAGDGEADKGNKALLDGTFPFVADAIIANPPSFAHVHIAERLGIPLHMMFTFPYSPTTAFPHPLANIRPGKSNVDTHYVNYMSYALVEMMTWQGLGDLVNDLRVQTLGLEPVSSLWAPGALNRMKVPYTYMWSPSLVPKPADWGKEIDLAGFVFLDLASNYKPPQDLSDFLQAGDAPIYIGFGSIVVDDPERFTQMIFDAVKMAGVRALINKGWGGFGGKGDVPEGIFMIDNVPHDWLFPRVKAVVHHGGAGTTAIGLKCGKPTMIVPFFGDQPFWGAMVAEKKAGAFQCIPYKKLTAENMAEGIAQCLTDEAQENVTRIAESIAAEGDGAENAVRAFHRALPLAGRHSMRCSILEDRVAVWQLRNSCLRLSALAAEILVEKGKVKWHELKLIRHFEWNDFDGPGEPISGSTAATVTGLYSAGEGVGMVPVRMAKHIKHRRQHEKKKQAVAARHNQKAAQKTAVGDAERPNPERLQTTTTLNSVMSADPTEPMYRELGHDVTSGFEKSGLALLNLPLNAVVATAQGFHNAPRLYGDATVRRPIKITGMKSGCKAAAVETGLAVWDGWSGVVTQPWGGWSDGATMPAKFAGLSRGLAMGLGGFVLKNSYAVMAPWACVGLGTRKWLQKRSGGPGGSQFIKHSRMTQGEHEERELDKEEPDGHLQLARMRGEVEGGWHVYEQIWTAAEVFKSSKGSKPVGKLKMERERRQWVENGLLENVRTAREALDASKNGQDLDILIAHRRRQVEEAEQLPETSVMDKPAETDVRSPGTEYQHDLMPASTSSGRPAHRDVEQSKPSDGTSASAQQVQRPPAEHEDSDATAVDWSSDEKASQDTSAHSNGNEHESKIVTKGMHNDSALAGAGLITVVSA